jgi:hypothetical protein
LPEIYRLRGECLLTLSRRNKAKARQGIRDRARRRAAARRITFRAPRRDANRRNRKLASRRRLNIRGASSVNLKKKS